jgi:hypothetical protein
MLDRREEHIDISNETYDSIINWDSEKNSWMNNIIKKIFGKN